MAEDIETEHLKLDVLKTVFRACPVGFDLVVFFSEVGTYVAKLNLVNNDAFSLEKIFHVTEPTFGSSTLQPVVLTSESGEVIKISVLDQKGFIQNLLIVIDQDKFAVAKYLDSHSQADVDKVV